MFGGLDELGGFSTEFLSSLMGIEEVRGVLMVGLTLTIGSLVNPNLGF